MLTGGYQLDRLDVLPPSQLLAGPFQMLISSQLPLPYLGLPNTVAYYLHVHCCLGRLLHSLLPDDCHAFLAFAESHPPVKVLSHLSAPTWQAPLQVDLQGKYYISDVPSSPATHRFRAFIGSEMTRVKANLRFST